MHRQLSRLCSLILSVIVVIAAVAAPVEVGFAENEWLFTIKDNDTEYEIREETASLNIYRVASYQRPGSLTLYKNALELRGTIPVSVQFDSDTILSLTLNNTALNSGITTPSRVFYLILNGNNTIKKDVSIRGSLSTSGTGTLTFDNANITSVHYLPISFKNAKLQFINNTTAAFPAIASIVRDSNVNANMSLTVQDSSLAFSNDLTLANFTASSNINLINATVYTNNLAIQDSSLNGLSTTGTNQVLYNGTANLYNVTSTDTNISGLEFGGTQSSNNHLKIMAASIGINELKNSSITPAFVTMENSSVTGNTLLNNTISHVTTNTMQNTSSHNIKLNNANLSIANMTSSAFNVGSFGISLGDNASTFSVGNNTNNNFQLAGGINSPNSSIPTTTGNFALGNMTNSKLEIQDEANLNAFTLQLKPGSQNSIQVGQSVKAADTINVDMSSGNRDARFASLEGNTVIVRGSGYIIGSPSADYAVRGQNVVFDLGNSQEQASLQSNALTGAAVLGNRISVSNMPNSRPNININLANITAGGSPYSQAFVNRYLDSTPSAFALLNADHRVLSGNNGTYIKGSNQPLILRFAGEMDSVQDVVLNNIPLNMGTDCTLTSGSVVLTLLPAYLETLPADGQWLPVDVYFSDSTISQPARIRVSNEPEPAAVPPKTGDGNHLGLWLALLALSLGCVVIATVAPIRKRTRK